MGDKPAAKPTNTGPHAPSDGKPKVGDEEKERREKRIEGQTSLALRVPIRTSQSIPKFELCEIQVNGVLRHVRMIFHKPLTKRECLTEFVLPVRAWFDMPCRHPNRRELSTRRQLARRLLAPPVEGGIVPK